MIKKFGIQKVEEMLNDKKPYKIRDFELENLLEGYKVKVILLAKAK